MPPSHRSLPLPLQIQLGCGAKKTASRGACGDFIQWSGESLQAKKLLIQI